MKDSTFSFGEYVLDLELRELRRQGELVPLSARLFDTLSLLVQRPGELITKEEFFAAVWPGVVVEENNLSQAISSLRKLLEENLDQPRYIVTVPGKGYQFVARVGVPGVAPPRLLGALAVVFVVVAVGLVWALLPAGDSPQPASIAVLPLEDIGTSPDYRFFPEGLHDEIVHNLSKIEGVRVTPRASVTRFRDERPAIRDIADQLGVATILEGSVQQVNDEVRVSLRLIRGADEENLWSQTFRRSFAELFDLQRDIASSVAGSLQDHFGGAQIPQLTPRTQSTQAYLSYLKAKFVLSDPTPGTSRAVSESYQAALDEALSHDPEFGDAYALKAIDQATAVMRPYAVSDPVVRMQLIERARENLAAAFLVDPPSVLAHTAKARLCEVTYNPVEARDHYERALQLDPNSRDTLIDYSAFAYRAGLWELFSNTQARLERVDPQAGLLGVNSYIERDYDEAVRYLRAWRDRIPLAGLIYFWLSMSLTAQGREAEARNELRIGAALTMEADPSDVDLAQLAYAQHRSGMKVQAGETVEVLNKRAATGSVSDLTLALAMLAIDDTESAYAHLEKAASTRVNRPFALQFRIQHNIFADAALDRPEFVALRDQLGFAGGTASDC